MSLRERDAVDCGVELPVASATESVSCSVGGPDGQGRGAVVACERGGALEPFDAGGLTEDVGGGERSAAADRELCRCELFDQLRDLMLELRDRDRQ